MKAADDEDPGTDPAFVGAAAWIVAALVGCAFVAWFPARAAGAGEGLRDASVFFRDHWLTVWPAVAILLGATVAPVVLLRARGRLVAQGYGVLAGLALLTVPLTWALCR